MAQWVGQHITFHRQPRHLVTQRGRVAHPQPLLKQRRPKPKKADCSDPKGTKTTNQCEQLDTCQQGLGQKTPHAQGYKITFSVL